MNLDVKATLNQNKQTNIGLYCIELTSGGLDIRDLAEADEQKTNNERCLHCYLQNQYIDIILEYQ